MTHPTDYQDLGIFPLQDHESGVGISSRMMMAGGRVAKAPHPESQRDPTKVLLEYSQERGKGTVGDIHPWFYWQTIDRSVRGMGAWSMAYSGVTVTGGTGGVKGGGNTGQPLKASGVLPIFGGNAVVDGRFIPKEPGYPKCFPSVPKGTMVMVMPGMAEGSQQEVMLHADPRLVAVHTEGPGEAGTLVCDLQPEGEMCMRDANPGQPGGPKPASEPGVGGRAARLQSMMRVVPLSPEGLGLPIGRGNGIAWNQAPAGIDKTAGLGLCWVVMKEGGGGGPTTPRPPGGGGPITPPAPPGKPPRGGGWKRIGTSGNLIGGPGGGGTAESGIEGARSGSSPCDFGEFMPKQSGQEGTTLMTRVDAFGPFTGGSGDLDKHLFGTDKDGNPITSGHIDTNAYFHENKIKDGPMLFEPQPYPGPPPLPLISRVHFVWDGSIPHPWAKDSKLGYWRWYAEFNCVCPKDGDKKKEPKGPKTPTGPGPTVPGPTTPGPGRPGPGKPGPITPPSGPGVPPRGGPTTPGRPSGGPGGPITPGPTAPLPIPPSGAPRIPLGPITHGPNTPAPPGPWKGRTYTKTPRGPTTGGPRAPGPIEPDEVPRLPGDPLPPNTGGSLPEEPGELEEYGERFGGPQGGRGGGGTEQFGGRSDTRHSVGDLRINDLKLYEIFHPMAEGFAHVSFRPQLMVKGAPSFIHNPESQAGDYYADEEGRPQVVAVQTWGGQTTSGEWDFKKTFETSRARGGTVDGGVMFTPPQHSLEDYFQINSAADVRTSDTTTFVAVAPNVSFALGTPKSTGGMNPKSVVIGQIPTGNDPLSIYQLNSAGASREILGAELDQASGELVVSAGAGGTQALRIPRGTLAQRQSVLTKSGGEIRIKTDGGTDVVEYYDFQNSVWTTLAAGAGSTTFTGLTDTPANYTAASLKAVRANVGETALEFIDLDTLYSPTADVVLRDGTQAMTGALAMGSNKITGLTAGASAGEAVEVSSALATFRTQSELSSTTDVLLGAKLIGIFDSAALFTATDVEAALAELHGDVTTGDALLVPLAGGTMTGALRLNDSVLLELGTGGDSTLTYDGTNTIWNPKAVGTGNVRIAGNLKLNDSDKILLGTGSTAANSDAEIYYSGVDLILEPDAIGSGNVQVNGGVRSSGLIRADAGFSDGATAGIDGSFSWTDEGGIDFHEVTVSGGLITSWTVS